MKSYTDISQSKKLAEILPFESADMFWRYNHNIHTYDDIPKILVVNNWDDDYNKDIPCWSIAALMNVLDRGALFITPQGWACQSYINFKAITSDYYDNPIDACVALIEKLHELKIL